MATDSPAVGSKERDCNSVSLPCNFFTGSFFTGSCFSVCGVQCNIHEIEPCSAYRSVSCRILQVSACICAALCSSALCGDIDSNKGAIAALNSVSKREPCGVAGTEAERLPMSVCPSVCIASQDVNSE